LHDGAAVFISLSAVFDFGVFISLQFAARSKLEA
jgi:hypothetical protein